MGQENGSLKGGEGLESSFESIGQYSDPFDPNYSKVLGVLLKFMKTHRLLGEAVNGNQRSLEQLIGESFDSSSHIGIEKLLHKAVAKNKTQLVRILLDKWDTDVNYEDSHGTRLIDLAINENNEEMIKLLLTAGADMRTHNRHGMSALDMAEEAYLTDYLDEPVYKLFHDQSLIKGPEFLSYTQPFKPKTFEDPSESILRACKSFRATVVHFYINSRSTEFRVMEQPTISELLFGDGLQRGPPDEIDDDRGGGKQLVCKWYHLPANNVSIYPYLGAVASR